MACLSAVALLVVAVAVQDPQLRRVILVLSLMLPLQVINVDWLYTAYESQWLPSIAGPVGRTIYALGTFLLVQGPQQVWIAAVMLVVELAAAVHPWPACMAARGPEGCLERGDTRSAAAHPAFGPRRARQPG